MPHKAFEVSQEAHRMFPRNHHIISLQNRSLLALNQAADLISANQKSTLDQLLMAPNVARDHISALLKTNQLEEAKKFSVQALFKFPGDELILKSYIKILTELGHLDELAELLTHLTEHPQYNSYLAELKLSEGKYQEALDILTHEATGPYTKWRLARAYSGLKNYQQARKIMLDLIRFSDIQREAPVIALISIESQILNSNSISPELEEILSRYSTRRVDELKEQAKHFRWATGYKM